MARSRIEGLGDALRAVGRIPRAMREARTETLHEWAETVQDGAEARVPRRTGDLWASLDHQVDERYGRARVGVWEEDQLEYAIYVEKGTSSMPDQPYLVPAFNEARPSVPAKYRAAFRRQMGRGE
ncbi:HK97-gp10 family putative phage morphogenesis protein [Streptomyces cucumeris]|uniref:HK97-gp10 family putative phage morphogenesis protein n=1 Tax=Streptomyces cucumeris TaxID=2962890 RepID=UPI003D7379EA